MDPYILINIVHVFFHIYSFIKYLKHIFFQIHHLWRLLIQGWGLMHGRVSLEGETSFKGGQCGGLEVEKKFNIWQQHWLPKKHPPLQPNCPLESFENHTVDTLIDPVTIRWNEELVDGLFVVEDAELIKKILLSRNVA